MEPKNATTTGNEQSERYSHGYEAHFVEGYLNTRTVSDNASFLMPHLRAGMTLLDCGCGPGSITTGFARALAPGQVVGIDIAESQIALARQQAEAQGIQNVRFEVANIYNIPFPDDSFDAAFAHTILQHLADPVRALREIHRVLKPGGVIGVREEDTAGLIFAPTTPLMDQTLELFVRTWQHNGGNPYFARHQRTALHAAGFVNTEGFAMAEHAGTAEATRPTGEMLSGYFATNLATAVEMGWTTQAAVAEMSKAWVEWGTHPQAYFAALFCAAVGWKP